MSVVSAGRNETAGAASANSVATAARASVLEADEPVARVVVSRLVIELSFLGIGWAGQFDGGLDAGERDERGLVDGPDGLGAVRSEQRQQAIGAGEEDRTEVADAVATGVEAAGGTRQGSLQHLQLVLADPRQPAFDHEQALLARLTHARSIPKVAPVSIVDSP